MSRLRRIAGVCGLAWRRFQTRAVATAPKRTWASVAGVAVAVVLLLVVTGLAVGMAGPAAGLGGDEYWVVPEDGASGSALVATGDPQFGEAHAAHERMLATDGVEAASPVLVKVLRFESDAGEREFLLAVGVIGDGGAVGDSGGEGAGGDRSVEVMGVDAGHLSAGDPHYAGGDYDGEWTGEMVLTAGTAELLGADVGTNLSVAGHGDRPLSVTAVDDGSDDVAGAAPVAVMHLSELQAITGADSYDGADRFVVETSDPAATDALAGIYEGGVVRSGTEVAAGQVLDSDLAVALSLAALLVAVVIGSLFVAATMAMEVAADRAQLTTLSAIGLSRSTRTGLYASQTFAVVTVGGLLGVAGGFLGIRFANAVAKRGFDVSGLLVSHPLLAGYGLATAWLVGLLSIPLVVLIVRRVEASEVSR